MPAKHKPCDLRIGNQLIDFHDVGRSIDALTWHVDLIDGYRLDGEIYLPFGMHDVMQGYFDQLLVGSGELKPLVHNKMVTIVRIEHRVKQSPASFTCVCSYDDRHSYITKFVPKE